MTSERELNDCNVAVVAQSTATCHCFQTGKAGRQLSPGVIVIGCICALVLVSVVCLSQESMPFWDQRVAAKHRKSLFLYSQFCTCKKFMCLEISRRTNS